MVGTVKRAGRLALLLGGGAALGLAGWWAAFTVYWSALAALYGWSLAANPFTPCWLCGGGGSRGDRTGIWPWAFGLCPVCHGAKERLRLGVRVLTPGRGRRLAAKYRTAEAARQGRPRRLVP